MTTTIDSREQLDQAATALQSFGQTQDVPQVLDPEPAADPCAETQTIVFDNLLRKEIIGMAFVIYTQLVM